jgi:hypothetical protein
VTRWWIIALVVVALGGRAEAHPIDIGYLRIDAEGTTLTTTLDLDAIAAGQLIRVEPEQLTPDGVREYESRLARATYRATQIATEAGPCTWTGGSIRRDRRVVLMTGIATCPGDGPPRTLSWRMAFLEQLPSTFQLFIQAPGFGENMPILDRAAPHLELASPVSSRSFGSALWSGVARWSVLDQLVFLLALLLVGGTVRELAAVAVASSAAHTVTFALAVAGILRPPAGLVTPLVSLAIIAAAFTAIAGVSRRRRQLAVELGLVQGVAIAAASGRDGHLGFYAGVELAHVVAALVLIPAVILLQRRRAAMFVLGAVACAYAAYRVLDRLLA